jgi:vitamin B12/bleomycin/antimicrobial peptide transport system ATP-binding/permease protein
LVQVLPAFVVAPRYFRGAVELGTVTQSFGAFSHTFSDLSLIVNRFDALSQLGAQVGRIQELCDAVETNVSREDRVFSGSRAGDADDVREESASRIVVCESSDGALSLERVSLLTPSVANPRELVRDVSVTVEAGGRLLIAGVRAKRCRPVRLRLTLAK